ncbi:hypothetical protein D3C87_54940 [compost metagenome]
MSFIDEFQSVDLILNSTFETRGVDAFALSLIKAERQIRKIFTFLVYQSAQINAHDISNLKRVLQENKQCYFEGFERGIDQISIKTVAEMIGERYGELRSQLEIATSYRNKIFHGQITGHSLQREDLVLLAQDIRTWCSLLSDACLSDFGFDGFLRNSFRKSEAEGHRFIRLSFNGVDDFAIFVAQQVQRRRKH